MSRQTKIVHHFFILLILMGAGTFFLQMNREQQIKEASKLHHIERLSSNILKANELNNASFDTATLSSLNVIEFLQLNNGVLPTIGAISIPSINMGLPIYNGVSLENMYFGAGTLKPHQKMGHSNYIIGSYTISNNLLLFGPLNNITMKDKIYLTDLEQTYVYSVDEIKTAVSVEDTDILDESDTPILTLITFSEKSRTHLVIQATLQQITAVTDTQN